VPRGGNARLQSWCPNGKPNAADFFAVGTFSQRKPIKASGQMFGFNMQLPRDEF
jgi:hypothetical protein